MRQNDWVMNSEIENDEEDDGYEPFIYMELAKQTKYAEAQLAVLKNIELGVVNLGRFVFVVTLVVLFFPLLALGTMVLPGIGTVLGLAAWCLVWAILRAVMRKPADLSKKLKKK